MASFLSFSIRPGPSPWEDAALSQDGSFLFGKTSLRYVLIDTPVCVSWEGLTPVKLAVQLGCHANGGP